MMLSFAFKTVTYGPSILVPETQEQVGDEVEDVIEQVMTTLHGLLTSPYDTQSTPALGPVLKAMLKVCLSKLSLIPELQFQSSI